MRHIKLREAMREREREKADLLTSAVTSTGSLGVSEVGRSPRPWNVTSQRTMHRKTSSELRGGQGSFGAIWGLGGVNIIFQ